MVTTPQISCTSIDYLVEKYYVQTAVTRVYYIVLIVITEYASGGTLEKRYQLNGGQ